MAGRLRWWALRFAASSSLLVAVLAISACHGGSREQPATGAPAAHVTAGPVVRAPESPAPSPAGPPAGVTIQVVPSKVEEPKVSYVLADPALSAAVQVSDIPEPEDLDDRDGRGVRGPAARLAPPGAAAALATAPAPTLGVRGLVTSFDAANFDSNATYTGGYYVIPPDANGAAGTNHVVDTVNSLVEFHTKAGVRTFVTSLQSFFASFSPLTLTFDPKVVYDPYADRFVLVVIERTDTALGDAANTSRIFVAVSDDGDPNGTWYATQIDAVTNVAGADRWIDYPGVAVDGQAIYVTGNMFGFGAGGTFAGVRLWVIAKSPLYSGGVATVSKLDPYAVGGSYTTTQPALTYGATPAGMGTFLVAYGGATISGVQYLQIERIDNPTGSPTITQQIIPMGTVDANTTAIVEAPQSGTATLVNTGDRRALQAVWRDGALWTTFHVRPPAGDPDAGQTTAHWVRIDTTNLSSLVVAEQGNIGGESIASGAYTFYPSVTVNSAGDAFFGFSASASSIFPGSYWTLRAKGDAAGTTRTPSVLHAGVDYYVRKFGATRNRWGDYSGATLDLASDCAWVFNEYAMARGTVISGEDGRWATTWGQVCPSAFLLSVGRTGAGSGSVASAPAGIDCGVSCVGSFAAGSTVTLAATAGAGSVFAGWSGGGCAGTGGCVVTMDGLKSVSAAFDVQTFPLIVTQSGDGAGSVTSVPAGIDCGATCGASFTASTVVTLGAVASAGSTFTGWSGGGCAGTGDCVVTMDAAKSVTAGFAHQTFALTVTKAGSGTGTVASAPAGVDCGATCAASFTTGTVVTLTATPASGATFTGWSGSGGCAGSGMCVVTMDASKSVTATFKGPCGAIGSPGGTASVLLALLAAPALFRRRRTA